MNSIFVPRLLRDESKDGEPAELSEFFSNPAIVVLGDPGSGKTELFRWAAELEKGHLLEARDFQRNGFRLSHDGPIYIDGLDEVRAHTEDGLGPIDNVVAALEQAGKPRFRLSCRAADWFGGVDTSQLAKVSDTGEVLTLNLLPLSDDDVRQIATSRGLDGDEVLERAYKDRLADWLRNPQTLNLLLEAFSGNQWPESRSELFHQACTSMAGEKNPTHARSERRRASIDRILKAAGHLAAVQLLAGTKGYTFTTASEESDFPAYTKVLASDQSERGYESALRCRLFSGAGPERFKPVHRTVAEYLGAQHLVDRVESGLPIERVLSLITASDGGIPSELRGIYGWFASGSREYQEYLVEKDPIAILLNGDFAALSPGSQNRLLRTLEEVSKQDPYLLRGIWHELDLSGLGSPVVEAHLVDIVKDEATAWPLQRFAVECLASAEPSPELAKILVGLIRSNKRAPVVRDSAASVLCKRFPHRTDEYHHLLQEIQDGKVEDPTEHLRHSFLKLLFPRILSAQELLRYVAPAHPGFLSVYCYKYLRLELVESLPKDTLAELLDALTEWEPPSGNETRRRLEPFLAGALVRGILELGDEVGVARLYSWLRITSLHLSPRRLLQEEHLDTLQRWMKVRPDLHIELFRHAVENHEEDRPLSVYSFRLLCPVDFPAGSGYRFLDFAAEVVSGLPAQSYFQAAVDMAFSEKADTEPTVDEICFFVAENNEFRDQWNSLRFETLDWRHKQRAEESRHEAELLERKEKTIQYLEENCENIRQGTPIKLLTKLSFIYYNLSHEPDLSDLLPEERLLKKYGKKATPAILEGFQASLDVGEWPSAKEVGEVSASSEFLPITFLLHAGVTLTWNSNKLGAERIPETLMPLAVTYHVATSLSQEPTPSWVDETLHQQEAACSIALLDYWQPSFEAGRDHISGLEKIDEWPEVGKRVTPLLLKQFPRCHHSPLKKLIRHSLRNKQTGLLIQLAREQLSKPRGLKTEQFLTWLVTAFLLDPESYEAKLVRHVPKLLRTGSTRRRAAIVVDLLKYIHGEGSSLIETLPSQGHYSLLRAIARTFPHLPTEDGDGKLGDSWEVPQWVAAQINQLGGHTAPQARELLKKLAQDSTFEHWRDHILHTLANQTRLKREQDFKPPSLAEVVRTLSGGPPANARDLFSIVSSELEVAADEIRNSPSDSYKSFWNLDPHGRVVRPHPEDICRDRLFERLKPRLERTGISLAREASHADHKRSDLKATHGSLSIPIECKRHNHPDLWTAIQDQLIAKYSRDPDSGGYGIYVVFWFGLEKLGKTPRALDGLPAPSSAAELNVRLRAQIPDDYQNKMKIVCFDVEPG